MSTEATLRIRVEPRDVPVDKAARRLGLTEGKFFKVLPELCERGFPPADRTTGLYDLKAIDRWMDNRFPQAGLTDTGNPEQTKVIDMSARLKQFRDGKA